MAVNYRSVLWKTEKNLKLWKVSDFKVVQHINERACDRAEGSGFQTAIISMVPCASPVTWRSLLSFGRNV